jgi:alanine racemase
MNRPTYALIHLDHIQFNLKRLREIADTPVMAVVKANGYGHGAAAVARAAAEVGVTWFGVAFAGEAMELRQAGITANILVLGYTPPDLARECIENDLSLAVYDLDLARHYGEVAQTLKRKSRLHLKVDTGMSRLGVTPDHAPQLIQSFRKISGVDLEGIFTHYATSDCADRSYAYEQLQRFNSVLSVIEKPRWVHSANSAAALVMPEARFDLVRCGITVYGLNPSDDVPAPNDFKPALEWKSTISQVKTFRANTPVSYGGEYVTKSVEQIAAIPVGYADGFRRFPKNVAKVIVGGKIVPVVGRVCMDQIMANVSHLNVKRGDEVVIIGKQGEAAITADDVANRWGTINYDVTSGIMARVPRIYFA